MLKNFSRWAENGKKELGEFYQRNRFYFLGMLLFAIVLYFPIMSKGLVNCYDGLWEGSYYLAGKWELSLGRWFWLYIDRLRFGISSEPMTSLITICCYALGLTFCYDLFGSKRGARYYLAGFLFLASTSVCIALSYRYMSPTFGVAFLCSILGIWFCQKVRNRYLAVLVGSVMICLSIGAYQAFIGCSCLLLLSCLIAGLNKEEFRFYQELVKGGLTLFFGGLEYLAVWNFHLWVCHVAKSSYAGADTYSVWNTIRHLPQSVSAAFQYFWLYYDQIVCKNVYFGGCVFYLIFFAAALLLLLCGIGRHMSGKKGEALLGLLLVAAYPVAAYAVMLVATETFVSVQMTGSYALVVPLLIYVLSDLPRKQLFCRAADVLALAAACLILYGAFWQTEVDQKTMAETKTTSVNVAREIHERLSEENLLSDDLRYCIVGRPDGTPMYYRSKTFWRANGYCYVGGGWSDASCITKSWRGLLWDICQFRMEICAPWEYEQIAQSEAVLELPVFPEKGCILQSGDVVVIRIN